MDASAEMMVKLSLFTELAHELMCLAFTYPDYGEIIAEAAEAANAGTDTNDPEEVVRTRLFVAFADTLRYCAQEGRAEAGRVHTSQEEGIA